jgi:soluble lytic murein transglycosylase-like protein
MYKFLKGFAHLFVVLLMGTTGIVEARTKAQFSHGSGGQIVMNRATSAQVQSSAAAGAASLVPARKSRSIILGTPSLPSPITAPTKALPNGATFATRLQYIERLMAQAGFSNFKGPSDLSTQFSNTNTVSLAQLEQVSNAYALGVPTTAAPFSNPAPIDADPTQATIGCMAFPYRPSGIMSSSNEYNRQLLFPHVRKAACDAGIPVGLFDALIMQESRYNATATSPKDAFGLAQLMPATAKGLGVNRYTIYDNLRGGASLLRQHLDDYGEVHLALAAYNAGPGAVKKYGGIPPYRETQNYVKIILDSWSKMSSAY